MRLALGSIANTIYKFWAERNFARSVMWQQRRDKGEDEEVRGRRDRASSLDLYWARVMHIGCTERLIGISSKGSAADSGG